MSVNSEVDTNPYFRPIKKSRFSETKIVSILSRHERGERAVDLCRELEVSQATFYKWKSKYGGLSVSEFKRIKEFEQENARLKKMYAELSLVHHAFKDAVEKKL